MHGRRSAPPRRLRTARSFRCKGDDRIRIAADRVAPDTASSALAFRRDHSAAALAEVRITKSPDFDQLAEERRWLRSFLAPLGDWQPPSQWTARVEQVLACPE